MIYVRRKKSDTWHFMENCSLYPALVNSNTFEDIKDLVIEDVKPTTGELCNQCLSKYKKFQAIKKSKAADEENE